MPYNLVLKMQDLETWGIVANFAILLKHKKGLCMRTLMLEYFSKLPNLKKLTLTFQI